MNKNSLLAFFLSLSLPIVVHAQTCQTNINPTTPTNRFSNNTTDTVTDNKTGLMWKRCGEGQTGSSCAGKAKTYSWQQAIEYVQTLNKDVGFEGYNDWRLPTAVELRSIVEEQCVNPAININIFPNTAPKAFWSSSPFAGFNDYAWYVNFNQGYDNYLKVNYEGNYLRLVRNAVSFSK